MKRIITSLVAAVLIALPLCAQKKASVRIGAYRVTKFKLQVKNKQSKD